MNQKKTFKPTLLLLKNLTYKTGGILVIDKCLHTMVGGCVFFFFFFLKKPLGKKIFPKTKCFNKITYQPRLPVLMAISGVWLCLVLNLLETLTQTPFFCSVVQY